MSEVEIKITDKRVKRTFQSAVGFITLFLLPLSLGIVMNNQAIQWVAFLYSLLLVVLIFVGLSKKSKEDEKGVKRFSSKQKAIDYINSL